MLVFAGKLRTNALLHFPGATWRFAFFADEVYLARTIARCSHRVAATQFYPETRRSLVLGKGTFVPIKKWRCLPLFVWPELAAAAALLPLLA